MSYLSKLSKIVFLTALTTSCDVGETPQMHSPDNDNFPLETSQCVLVVPSDDKADPLWLMNGRLDALEQELRAIQSPSLSQGEFHENLTKEFTDRNWDIVGLNVKIFAPLVTILIGLGGMVAKGYSDRKDEDNKRELSGLIEQFKEANVRELFALSQRTSADHYNSLCEKGVILYEGFDPPIKEGTDELTKQQKLYNRYLDLACDLAGSGYKAAQKLEKTFVDRGENDKWMAHDQWLVNNCLNNYVFYLGSRASLDDKSEIGAALTKFKKLVEKEEADQSSGWWNHKGTFVWAQLNLGHFDNIKDAEDIMQSMLDMPEISDKWKDSVIVDFERYNVMYGLGGNDRITLKKNQYQTPLYGPL